MPDQPTIGNSILKFTGDTTGDQVSYLTVIDDVTERTVKIDGYKLEGIFGKNFKIPDYQRGYQWSSEEWDELWEEIEQLFRSTPESASREVSDVFFGSMFLSRIGDSEEGDEIYEVIDGQQRITTLSIIFYLIRSKLNNRIRNDDEYSLFDSLGDEPGSISSILYRSTGAGAANDPAIELDRKNRELFEALLGSQDDRLEFILQREVLHPRTTDPSIQVKEYLSNLNIPQEDYFEALNDSSYYSELDDDSIRPNLWKYEFTELGDNADSGTDLDDETKESILNNRIRVQKSNLLLVQVYDYFNTKLEDELNQFGNIKQEAYALTNLKNYLLHSFHIGYFEVEEEQPRLLMKIFEILNDRGVELKKTDVIRTRIVGTFRGEADGDEYIEKWEDVMDEFGDAELVNDFLQTFFVVDGDVTSRGETTNRLLEAFSSSNGSSDKLDARLGDMSTAKGLMEDLVRYAEYYHHIIDPENYGIDLGEDGDKEIERECNRIITRLTNANTSIWEPLVLAFYHDVREDSIGHQNLLLELLKDIESMAIRSFATMDTNVRDSAYADAMAEYHDADSLTDDIADELTDIETDDPQAVGEELAVALCRTDWRPSWGKQVLRKIASENFETDNAVVLRELNVDNNVVHLEHILPQSPFLDGENEYSWFKHFFRTADADVDDTDEVDEDSDLSLEDLVNVFISEGADDSLEDIISEYQEDLGNLALLRYRENIQIENQLYGVKLSKYNLSKGFCELRCNEYICNNHMSVSEFDTAEEIARFHTRLNELDSDDEDWEDVADEMDSDATSQDELEEKIEDSIADLMDDLDSLNPLWDFEAVTEHRADLVEVLCDSIAFSDDEFDEVDFERVSENETERRNNVITANYERQIR